MLHPDGVRAARLQEPLAHLAVGLPAAASLGLLRMGADRHYLTDVLVGAAAGTIFGVGMPLLLHGRQEESTARATSLSMNVSGGLGGVVFSGQF